MKATATTHAAAVIIAGMSGEFRFGDLRTAAAVQHPAVDARQLADALYQFKRRGIVAVVRAENRSRQVYRFVGQDATPRRLTPVERAWREFRASMGDLTIPDLLTGSLQERHA